MSQKLPPASDAEQIGYSSADLWTHLPIQLKPDARRTVLRPFMADYPAAYSTGTGSRTQGIIDRLLGVDEPMLERGLKRLSELIENRHRDAT